MGDSAAFIIAKHYHLDQWDEQNLKGCCPFHHEDTPSFMWNKKEHYFKCFGGETTVITKDGIKTLKEIVNKPVEIINGNGKWEMVTFKNYGKQTLMKVTLTSNSKEKIIFATPEHEWLVYRKSKKISTKDLKSGQRLKTMWLNLKNDNIEIDTEGLRHGFLYGDGSTQKYSYGYGTCAYAFTDNKFDFVKTIFDTKVNKSSESSNAKCFIYYKSEYNPKEIPSCNHTKEYLLGFLAGYFATDGNCSDDSVMFNSANKEDMIKIKHICTILGIATYPIGETIRTKDSNSGCAKYNREYPLYTMRLVSTTLPKNFYVSNKIFKTERKYNSRLGYKVVSVEDTDRYEDVYCCVTSTHSFVLDGFILTGNCFGCGKTLGILDLYTELEGSYKKALKRLFEEVEIECDLKDYNPNKIDRNDYFKNYIYPKEETNTDRSKVEEYLGRRGISKATLDYMDVKQDSDGNIVYELRDLDNTLLAVKYRPSHAVKHGKIKMWWQTGGVSNCPLLYNINKIDITKPLVITEGYQDTLACVEAGYSNVCSIHGGANDLGWIEFNYDFLENFTDIRLWFDNDAAGEEGLNNTINRLGEYRCKVIKPTSQQEDKVEAYYKTFGEAYNVRKTDANNILLSCGKNDILQLIENAESIPDKRLKFLMDFEPMDIRDIEKVSTGFKNLDDILYGTLFPSFTIWSGATGSGKSSIANISSIISPVENGYKTFVLSGELDNGQLASWIISPLAGRNHTLKWENDGGVVGYSPTRDSLAAIRKFYRNDMILYSDEDGLDTSGETVLKEMENAYKRYGCRSFLIDNLMTIDFEGFGEDSKWDSQKKFMIRLMGFTNKYKVATSLIVHPTKSSQTNQFSGGAHSVYDLAGSSDIGNLCHRLLFVDRLKDDADGYDIKVSVVKDRPTSMSGKYCKLNYDKPTKRIYSDISERDKIYNWEKNTKLDYSDFIKKKLICNIREEQPPY